MVVFIGNLPKTAAERDLCHLARLAAGTHVRIVKKKSRSGDTQRFALVPVTGEGRLRRLINRLHGLLWRGQTLVAREYAQRTGAHERRRVDWRHQAWIGVERRINERRSAVVTSMVA